MSSLDARYGLPWEIACGLNEKLNGAPPREKSTINSARLDSGGNLLFYCEGGRARVAAELRVEPLSLYVC